MKKGMDGILFVRSCIASPGTNKYCVRRHNTKYININVYVVNK